MYEITVRALTEDERERVGRSVLDERTPTGPAGRLPAGGLVAVLAGCQVLVLIGTTVFGFLGGGLVGVLAAWMTGNLEHTARFVLWGGGMGAGLFGLRMIVQQVRGASKSRRKLRAMQEGTHDFGKATVVRCEAAAAACVREGVHDELVWILSVGEGELLVLRGSHIDEAREKHGFPHSRFELTALPYQLVLEYRAEGEPLDVQEIDYGALAEDEANALREVGDQTVLDGTIETCVADITRQYRAWRY